MDIPHAKVVIGAAFAAAITVAPAATASTPAIPWEFNGDGRADLAVGTPHEDGNRGAVNVIYGSATGLTATGDDYWTQDSPGIGGAYVSNRSMGFGARSVRRLAEATQTSPLPRRSTRRSAGIRQGRSTSSMDRHRD